ncbi:hypothetical protein BDQ12DRAFT_718799 [Crucibulum laeve]|uniref:RRM domain-containing protein n=1 Tax=Crucibulum laeve TaxID=68775 RepID=A0A5C3MDW7_9AGAR|nr:hypothetical protein BDQ12DRAFT_718799 [Crucibulum laeve]
MHVTWSTQGPIRNKSPVKHTIKRTVPPSGTKRTTVNQRHAKHKSVAHAAKKADKKRAQIEQKAQLALQHANQTVRRGYNPVIYVGNLQTHITEAKLAAFFTQSCGKVVRVILRRSRGQTVPTGATIPAAVRTKRDRLYATVEFQKPEHVRNVFRDGIWRTNHCLWIFEGCKMMVSLTAADLPEVEDIVQIYMSKYRGMQAQENLIKMEYPDAPTIPNPHAQSPAQRPLTRQDTESVIKAESPKANDRPHFFGISFAQCVA